jgi:hypothetical protein
MAIVLDEASPEAPCAVARTDPALSLPGGLLQSEQQMYGSEHSSHKGVRHTSWSLSFLHRRDLLLTNRMMLLTIWMMVGSFQEA